MHAGLLKHDASPDQGYAEVAGMLGERSLMEEIGRRACAPQVAILSDYEDLWALQIQPHGRAFRISGHSSCCIGRASGWASRATSCRPRLTSRATSSCLRPRCISQRKNWQDACGYVHGGGHLVLGVRSGFKTESDVVTDLPLPGLFRDLVAADVRTGTRSPPGRRVRRSMDGKRFAAGCGRRRSPPGPARRPSPPGPQARLPAWRR